jgi:hypothetical protein
MRIKNPIDSLIVAVVVIGLTALAIVAGCSVVPGKTEAPFPWQQRFMAEVAIVSATSDVTPGPRPQPKIGDKCRDCNDPPGACGVGRVGDGRDCDRCGSCGGDGKIDERDLMSDVGDIGDEPSPPERSITLHMSHGSQGWGGTWWHEARQPFVDSGWKVFSHVATEGVIPAPYFVVVDGESSTQFHEPLTAELLEGWER